MKRVFVTGLGAVTPIGIGIDEFCDSLECGKNGVGKIKAFDASNHSVQIAAELKDFEPELYMDKKSIRRQDNYARYAICATNMAINQAGFKNSEYDKHKVGVILSTGIGGIKTFEKEFDNLYRNGPGRVSPFLVPMMICNIAAGSVAMEHGFMGPNYSAVSACASGLHSIGEAYQKIITGECDIMIAGGTEAAITPLTVAGFAKMKALSTRNDEPLKASRPFDKDRDGFVMGEGSAVVVLESEQSVLNRKAKPLAELKGYGATADAHHLTAPHPEGEGGFRAMQKAINYNQYPVESINYVNAHGTSTPLGDVAELKAVRRIFNNKMDNVTVNATKSMIGHLLGAAGAAGVVATVLQIQKGFVHPTINLDNPDDEISDIDFAANTKINKQITAGLVNSFGFGGQNASLLITKISD